MLIRAIITITTKIPDQVRSKRNQSFTKETKNTQTHKNQPIQHQVHVKKRKMIINAHIRESIGQFEVTTYQDYPLESEIIP